MLARILTPFIRRVEVRGDSMAPTYVEGEVVTAFRRWRKVRVGDVVVLSDPRATGRLLLKRCRARHGSRIDVRGDNAAASTDSREFGPVEIKNVTWLIYAPRAPIDPTMDS